MTASNAVLLNYNLIIMCTNSHVLATSLERKLICTYVLPYSAKQWWG